jgi:C-terminal processing protease CtpA/Prc
MISSLSPTGNARLRLKTNDRILSIGSVPTSDVTDVEEIKRMILGPAGSLISMVCAAPCSCSTPDATVQHN